MLLRKRQPIDSLKDGNMVDDVFAVKLKKGVQPYAKGHTFHLLLTDSSGRSIDYKYWGGPDAAKVKALYDSIPSDGVVHVLGKVTTYQDKPQISTNEPDTVRSLAEGEYDSSDFIPVARRDVEAMWAELEGLIGGVKDPATRELLETVFNDPRIREKFKNHPGAIEIHHNWVGGLMQHTLEVAEYSLLSRKLFPDLDMDILVAGSLLHDIGKLEEIEVKARIKGTKKGQLKGHISLGYAFVSKVIDRLCSDEAVSSSQFPVLTENRKPKTENGKPKTENGKPKTENGKPETEDPRQEKYDKILHIVLSHHGSLEYGSPKPPMTPEAFAVYYADEMSSKLAEITDYVKWARENTDDDFMYHKRHQRNILLD
ncbi:MAG: HD domain-containing protein [Candidatus Altiarchaeota archaeon]